MDDYIAPRGEARCSRKNTLENDLCGATICYLDEGLPGPIHRTQVENFPAGPLSIPVVSGFPRALPHVATIAAMHGRCPLWVRSRHLQRNRPCPLYPESGHVRCTSSCLLWANSRHSTGNLSMELSAIAVNVRLCQKQTYALQEGMSALPPKADMCSAAKDVCYGLSLS